MADIVLVTGGARSGKSRFAQKYGESVAGARVYVATCPVMDGEMLERIRRHQEDRRNKGWDTLEETLDLENLLATQNQYEVVLVDCLTLWVNNLLYDPIVTDEVTEDYVKTRMDGIVGLCRKRKGAVIFVTNEVGYGVVPDNPLARTYRDLIGRCNQTLGRAADRVVLTVCGIPTTIKECK